MTHPISRWAGTCHLTGKRCFASRKDVKAAARRFGGGMSAYRCQPDPDLDPHWHMGRLPKPVVAGELTRDDIRRRYP